MHLVGTGERQVIDGSERSELPTPCNTRASVMVGGGWEYAAAKTRIDAGQNKSEWARSVAARRRGANSGKALRALPSTSSARQRPARNAKFSSQPLNCARTPWPRQGTDQRQSVGVPAMTGPGAERGRGKVREVCWT
jgi:hypothetical protein